ncbi:MAG TPA: L,D-transpeptidase [Phenylobacterium sp.]
MAAPNLDPSETVLKLVGWVTKTGDNRGLPFVIIDKISANVFVFDGDGAQLGVGPALLGLAQGDDSVPGIGDRPLAKIQADEKTTPAGRFMAAFGPAPKGKKVLWVDYDTAISLHPVITTNPKEHRTQRLKSAEPDDNRITYGCINVSPAFYNKVVRPAFRDEGGVVYILPEVKAPEQVFPGLRARPTPVQEYRGPSNKRWRLRLPL